ncbi:THUMP domain-containing class I SAM-dependent RNA methyltransferase [Sinanaerobacter chloroacetimidivorans]|uniref:Class I SAM-dependent RNA methyltransferase n=1 Tax=Sinanaerobacter chloroacetimidivorans TaxID=2818044 RepID=A0A8J8B3E2_9FIRM|nr:class I SAM-dependent RNA methyltransferase [Sinanaerobacter chloroacetimidivorans]MBR0599696.1 class I SAM-dependent RNA methyltransferase [Sinanaerobacter chloroacetimidivorans]
MAKLEIIATATFGLEAVVKREIENLGYKVIQSEDAKITYLGDERAVVKSNLWLRCADRVLIKLGEFQALTFEELFQQTKAIPWEEWIPEDGKILVSGTSVKSKLHSVPDCQSIVKKAIIERMKETYHSQWFSETGADYGVKVTLLKDRVTITLDTSGSGLHKRGYRVKDVAAPIKETLAAAMVQLSFWKEGRLLLDPFCGSGTIPIEAAMIARNIAPGLSRKFAAETWEAIPQNLWKEERKAAYQAMKTEYDIRIQAADISAAAVKAARENAEEAGVDDCIEFRVMPLSKQRLEEDYGVMICNPPYGERIGDKEEIHKIYREIKQLFQKHPTWSLYLITTDKDFENLAMGRPADRRRKLYNGRLEVQYYQYYGLKPQRG